MAVKIRKKGKTAEDVMQVVCRDTKKGNTYENVRISAEVYEKYFYKTEKETVTEVINQALEAWFRRIGDE